MLRAQPYSIDYFSSSILRFVASQFFRHPPHPSSTTTTTTTMPATPDPPPDESPRKRLKVDASSRTEDNVQSVKEAEVGITEFASSDDHGFFGILKKR